MSKDAHDGVSDPAQASLPGLDGAPNEPAPMPLPTLEDLGPRFAAFVEGLTRPIVFFDTETTGTDPVSDRIIEISLIKVSPAPVGVEAPRTWRVNPQMRIPAESSAVHGIDNDAIQDAPPFAEIAAELEAYLKDCDFAGFNVGRFDVRVLQSEFMRAGIPFEVSDRAIVDAQVIFHRREPRNLSAALRFYRDKELVGAHGAEADTVATLEVFAGQLARYDDLATQVSDLHALSVSINDNYCDIGRRFQWRDNEPVFNFGKLKGKSLRWAASDPNERNYLRWMLEGTFEPDAKAIVREALEGKIRIKGAAAEGKSPTDGAKPAGPDDKAP